jgi:hypothetical protein
MCSSMTRCSELRAGFAMSRHSATLAIASSPPTLERSRASDAEHHSYRQPAALLSYMHQYFGTVTGGWGIFGTPGRAIKSLPDATNPELETLLF